MESSESKMNPRFLALSEKGTVLDPTVMEDGRVQSEGTVGLNRRASAYVNSKLTPCIFAHKLWENQSTENILVCCIVFRIECTFY